MKTLRSKVQLAYMNDEKYPGEARNSEMYLSMWI